MKLKIVKQELHKVLLFAQEASERDNINSYYSYFIFIAENNTLTIKSANRQTTFEQQIISDKMTKLEILENGSYLIPGIKILNIVGILNDGLISLTENNMDMLIKEEDQNKSDIEFTIRMRNIDDYPKEIHNIETTKFCTVNKEALLNIIDNTSFAVSSNMKESSMFLTGIFFDIEDNNLSAVATDRNRMSISKIKVDGISEIKKEIEEDIIVPLKSILFLKRIVQKLENLESIKIFLNKDKLFFQANSIMLSTNLISGKYYGYKKIIPEEKRNVVTVNTKELKEAVSRVSVANDDRKENNVLFTIENNKIVISVEEKEKSKAKISVLAKKEGNPVQFLIKTQFILDPLSIIKSENIFIDYGESVRDLIKIFSTEEINTIHISAQINR